MKKLSEYTDQTHIVSVLRAMVIRNTVNNKLAICGNADVAHEIFLSFFQSLNCRSTNRGDACGECDRCIFLDNPLTWGDYLLDWHLQYVENAHSLECTLTNTLYASTNELDGFMHFQVKEAIGTYINSEILTALIYAYQSTREDAFKAALSLSKSLLFTEFLEQYLDIFLNVLYLKINLEVKETQKLDALRALSVRLSTFDVTACIRLLWDAQKPSALPDTTRIQVVCLLILEILQPSKKVSFQEIWDTAPETPIKDIDDNVLEQPLDLSRMLEIAQQ